MTEEILIKLDFDMARIVNGQRRIAHLQETAWRDQEAKQYGMFKTGLARQEAEQIASDQRMASRRLDVMRRLEQRHQARVSKWRQETEALRVKMAGPGENREGGNGGHGGHGGANSGVISESFVLIRETLRGAGTGRILSSANLLMARLNLLGRVLGFLANPVTIATGVILGLGYAAQRIGKGAQQTLLGSQATGFTSQGYQGVLQAAGREEGGTEAAKAGLEHLTDRIGEARAGSEEVYKNFRKWGIAIDDANGNALTGQKIYTEILSKIEATTDPAKRLALITDMFGDAGPKFQKTLLEGQSGFEASQAGQPNARNLAGLSTVGQILGGSMNGSSGLFAGAGSLAKGAWHMGQDFLGSVANTALDSKLGNGAAFLGNALVNLFTHPFSGNYKMGAGTVNSGDAEERGRQIDAKAAALVANGTIKGTKGSAPEEFRRAFLTSQERLAEAQAAIDDRGKVSLADGAGLARRMTGDVLPQIHTVTKRMRTMLKIQDLEAQSQVDFLNNDDVGMRKHQGMADAMRKANTWMMRGDVDPTAKLVAAVSEIKLAMAPLIEMANKFNMDASKE